MTARVHYTEEQLTASDTSLTHCTDKYPVLTNALPRVTVGRRVMAPRLEPSLGCAKHSKTGSFFA